MNKRVVSRIALLGGIVFIALQFYQPPKNLTTPSSTDFFAHLDVPITIQQKIKVSCYDCHSNQTRYPWYNKVSPVSWMLYKHVLDGKKALNFSEWGNLSKRKKIGTLGNVAEVIELRHMPLKSYLLMHKDAKFTKEEIKEFSKWAEKTTDVIMEN